MSMSYAEHKKASVNSCLEKKKEKPADFFCLNSHCNENIYDRPCLCKSSTKSRYYKKGRSLSDWKNMYLFILPWTELGSNETGVHHKVTPVLYYLETKRSPISVADGKESTKWSPSSLKHWILKDELQKKLSNWNGNLKNKMLEITNWLEISWHLVQKIKKSCRICPHHDGNSYRYRLNMLRIFRIFLLLSHCRPPTTIKYDHFLKLFLPFLEIFDLRMSLLCR